jgi:hypothetical protein
MKAIIVLSIFTFAYLNWSYGQTTERIKIPLLKENKLIDDLLDSLLMHRAMPKIANNELHGSNYILITIRKNSVDSSFSFSASTDEDEGINCVLSDPRNPGKHGFGYILYHRYTVFFRINETFNLFDRTLKSMTFKVIHSPNCDDPLSMVTHLDIDYYLYKNGRLSVVVISGAR